jgi:hypothetical protein
MHVDRYYDTRRGSSFSAFSLFSTLTREYPSRIRHRRAGAANRIDTLPPFVNSLTTTMNASRDACANDVQNNSHCNVFAGNAMPQFAKLPTVARTRTRARARARGV